MTYVHRFAHSVAFYPVTIVYGACAAVIGAIAGHFLRADVALLLISLIAVMSVQVSMRREVRRVHVLVNSQRDELVARIDQLVRALRAAGVTIPADPAVGGSSD